MFLRHIQQLKAWTRGGKLVIVSLLFSELLVVLWFAFAALFSFEMLLPTFVTARLSLTNSLAWLILGTLLALWLRQRSGSVSLAVSKKTASWLLVIIIGYGLAIGILASVRFSLLSGIGFFSAYCYLSFLLWQEYRATE